MQLDALLAMKHLLPGDAGLGFGNPEWRPPKRHVHAGGGALFTAFVDIGEFVLIERIVAHAERECVQRSVPPIPGLIRRLKASRDDMLEIHGRWFPGSRCRHIVAQAY